MKKLLLIILCSKIFFVGCTNSSPYKSKDSTNNETITKEEVQNSWSENEKNGFLSECFRGASSSNTSLTESQIKNYCNCCLEEMMLKYDRPTSNLDMEWFQVTSINCESKVLK